VPAAATACRNAGIILMTVIAETLMTNSSEMLSIASNPTSRNVLVTPTLSTVSQATTGVVAATCNSVSECQSNPCQNGGTCIDGYGLYYCRCPQSYTGYNCDRQCSTPQLDVVFVLDISGSVQQEYQISMSFASAVVYGLDIDSGNIRVGAVAFSTIVVGQFYLSDFTSREAVVNGLRFYNAGGTTNTAGALYNVLNTQFTATHGARSGAQKVVILVSDGYSNVNPDQTVPSASALKNNVGAVIYSVANGDNPQFSELTNIASSPQSQYVLPLLGQNNIASISSMLLDKLCSS
jgi:collagen type VI alpha